MVRTGTRTPEGGQGHGAPNNSGCGNCCNGNGNNLNAKYSFELVGIKDRLLLTKIFEDKMQNNGNTFMQ